MYRLFFILFGLFVFEGINSSPLPESENNENNESTSDDETTIDRESSEKDETQSRKRYAKKKVDDTEVSSSLESLVVAIDTGVKKFMAGKNTPDIIDTIAKTLVDFAKHADPIYRTKGQAYDIKPEVFQFRTGKPSVMFEINSKSIINVLKDVLQSKVVHKYLDKFSQEAAIIYRALKTEMDKTKSQPRPYQRPHN